MQLTKEIKLSGFDLSRLANNSTIDPSTEGVIRIYHPNNFELILFNYNPKNITFKCLLSTSNSTKVYDIPKTSFALLEQPFLDSNLIPLRRDHNYETKSMLEHYINFNPATPTHLLDHTNLHYQQVQAKNMPRQNTQN